MESPTRCACASFVAPVTRSSTRRVAPSPSRAIWRASEAHVSASAATNAASSASPTLTPEVPEASTSTVSLVLMSPSTLMRLKLCATAARSARRSRGASMAASVVSTASMVAMFGWIMPAPLANPEIVIAPPPRFADVTAIFARVSVVVIACAASPGSRFASGPWSACDAALQLVQVQEHADDAGREHEHLVGPRANRRGTQGLHALRVGHAALARDRVGAAGVREHAANARGRGGERFAIERDGSRLHAIGREHAGRRARAVAPDHRQVQVAALLEPAGRGGAGETRRQREAGEREGVFGGEQ